MQRSRAVVLQLGCSLAAVLGITTTALAVPTGFSVNSYAGVTQGFYSIDLATGAATLLGPGTDPAIDGLTFSPTGTLYGVDTDNGAGDSTLVTLSTADGTVSVVGSLGLGDLNGAPTGMTFTPDGRLWMTTQGNFYEVDPSSGVASLVGSIGTSTSTALASDCEGTVYGLNYGGRRSQRIC